ncbi:MAG: acyloxyacyl hydrolase [Terracidiphilus sp.]
MTARSGASVSYLHIQTKKSVLTRFFIVAALLSGAAGAAAQQEGPPPLQVYAGYSRLSNSFNGVPGSQNALNGWNAGVAFQQWHHLRFKLDYSMFRGMNAGVPQHGFFILGGGQYEIAVRRERFFAEALAGEGGLNGNWYVADTAGYKNGNTGMIASFAAFLGGGIDTPVGRHAAIRVEGGVQRSGFEPITPAPLSEPYHLNGIPNYFGRLSVGMVWLPRPGSALLQGQESSSRTPVESEIIFEGMDSFGHFHIFANSWWSDLSVAGIEYDRHSWGNFIGAHVDYSAEILPVVILRQPTETDIWGNPIGAGRANREIVPGVGILPIGVRLLWRDGTRLEPYYVIKGGMTGYTKKTFSQDAAYENFCLDQSIGIEFRLSDRVGFRAGFGVFHQSNGFVVPSNPGLDAMNLSGGISYRLGHSQRRSSE